MNFVADAAQQARDLLVASARGRKRTFVVCVENLAHHKRAPRFKRAAHAPQDAQFRAFHVDLENGNTIGIEAEVVENECSDHLMARRRGCPQVVNDGACTVGNVVQRKLREAGPIREPRWDHATVPKSIAFDEFSHVQHTEGVWFEPQIRRFVTQAS
jgi:hypothetical protein